MHDDAEPASRPLDARVRAHADAGLDAATQPRIEAGLTDRLGASTTRRGRLRAWFAGHLVVAAAVGVVSVAGAGATAAVVIQQVSGGTPSPPTVGEVPRLPGETRKRDLGYEITVSPFAEVGLVGWCSSAIMRFEGELRPFGGTGCGYAPHAGQHVFGGGTSVRGRGRGLFAYSIVDRTVAYALTSGRTPRKLVPASDPRLPNGWRVIVQLPGESHTGNLRYRDAAGRPLSTRISPDDAVDTRRDTGASTTDVAPEAPCSVALSAGWVPRGARWLTALTPTAGISGRALLPCAQVRFKLTDEEWAEATVFVDAAQPGTAPMPLPSATPSVRAGDLETRLDASHYLFDVRTRERMPNGNLGWGGSATARPVGERAWLVVRSRTRAQRIATLDGLRVEVRTP